MVSPPGEEPEKPRHCRERLVACGEIRIRRSSARYPDRTANSERSGDRRSAVLADHSTDGSSSSGTGKVGNCSPTGPTVGLGGKVMRHAGCRLRGSYPQKGIAPRNRMREIFTSGSVRGAPGNRCLYPEADAKSRAAD
jgi:hypothetical protein